MSQVPLDRALITGHTCSQPNISKKSSGLQLRDNTTIGGGFEVADAEWMTGGESYLSRGYPAEKMKLI